LESNPIEGAWDPNAAAYDTCGAPAGSRRLYCLLVAAGLPGNFLGSMPVVSSHNRERYDEIAVQFQHRFTKNMMVRANYTYSRNYTYLTAQDQDQLIEPINWGPAANDQPHALSVFGIFSLPAGIQLSPVLQAASGRPYNLTEGIDLNKDGDNNDRYLPCGIPTMCSVVGPDSARGAPTFTLDLRGTKFFNLGHDGVRKIGIFVEGYNLTNHVNFGSSYNGSCAAKNVGTAASPQYQCTNANFQLPDGYLPGLGYTRQMQLGARFIF
jgi:hypothetical protein